MASVLERVNSPEDLRGLSEDELVQLAGEIRTAICTWTHANGGHLGSNLGVVELTIALHRTFHSPADKIVFDTSHQSYTHKILTGRKQAFLDPALYHSVSGFTNPAESEHDLFRVGHTSTSISMACGLAKARDLLGQHHDVIAVIGDGALSGGEAFEGLDNAALVGTNLIIVVNDNEMSIAEDRGGMYAGLAELRRTKGASERNIFRDFGLDYRYVEDGNDIHALLAAFDEVRGIDHPVVVHVHTRKGKGDPWSEAHVEASHHVKADGSAAPAEDYRSITRAYLGPKMARDHSVIAVNAGAPGGSGLTPEFRAEAGDQFFDVGICEQHAVSFVSGLARGGAKPVFFVASTFLQRAYDQLLQDLALNRSPATVLVFDAGFSSLDSTHVGCFDITFCGNIPGLTCLAPATREQYVATLDWSIDQQEGPVVIRVPDTLVSDADVPHDAGVSLAFDPARLGQTYRLHQGAGVALLGLGSSTELMEEVAGELRAKTGVDATILSATSYSALDRDVLDSLVGSHAVVATFENGMLYGGFGEKVARYLGDKDIKTVCFGGTKHFIDRVPEDEIRELYCLEPAAVAHELERFL